MLQHVDRASSPLRGTYSSGLICSVMSKVVKAVEAQMDDFDGVQLVNVMWSFGKLEVNPGAAVVHRICERLAVMLVDLSPQVCQ